MTNRDAILYRVEMPMPWGGWEAIYLTYDKWRAEKRAAERPESRITVRPVKEKIND